jgi:hypothetical protein
MVDCQKSCVAVVIYNQSIHLSFCKSSNPKNLQLFGTGKINSTANEIRRAQTANLETEYDDRLPMARCCFIYSGSQVC